MRDNGSHRPSAAEFPFRLPTIDIEVRISATVCEEIGSWKLRRRHGLYRD
jgi:hypothetical protein